MSALDILLSILVVFLWSLNLIAVKLAVAEVPVFILAGFRFIFVGVCLLPWFKVRDSKTLFHLAILALILGIGHFAAFFYGMKFVGAGLTAIILNTQVPLGMILACLLLGERSSFLKNLGVSLALLGIVILFWDPEASANLKGVAIIFFAALAWGFSNVYIRKYLSHLDSKNVLCGMSLFAGLLLSCLALFNGQSFDKIIQISFKAQLAITYIIFCSTFIAYGFWFYLIAKYQVIKLSPYLLLMPVFGVILGVICSNETLGIAKVLGAFLVLLGVAACTLNIKQINRDKCN